MDIELSSEFIVMASELMLIKSKMLLPRDEETEEDPRAALAAAMLEYQRTKAVSASLARMFLEYGTRMIKDTDEIKPDTSFIADHDAQLLRRAMIRMLSEVRISDEEAMQRFEPLIQQKTVSVAEAGVALLENLKKAPSLTLYRCFSSARSRSELIALFMAILELLKSGAILLSEETYAEDGIIRSETDAELRLNPEADPSAVSQFLSEETNF